MMNQTTINKSPITKVGVVGAGTMGSAIAQHFMMKGLDVTLIDQTDEYLSKGLTHIKQSLSEAKDRRIISAQQYEVMLSNLTTSIQKTQLANCELIVEAVFEDLSVKKNLFKALENIVSNKCILASNTSSFLVTEIAAGLQYPQRVIGVHYFYHAAKNKLIEVIPGEETAADITYQLLNFYNYFDKTPIQVKDTAGFAVNRFFVPWLNEAVRLLEEGFGSIKTIDRISRDVFGVGMGPFALMNATGVAIAMHAASGLAEKLGAFYQPANLLVHQVATGKDWDLDDDSILNSSQSHPQVITERMVAATLGVAAQMVSEGVVDATSADLGARSGLAWPMGPFELMNKLGIDPVKKMVTKLFNNWKMSLPGFPFNSDNQTNESHTIPLDWVTHQVYGETGFIQFNLPDRMNPLGEETMRQLNFCVDLLNQNSTINKIIFMGKGKAFIAGADIKFFVDSLEANDLNRIQSFTEFGQKVLNKISASSKTTYAYLNGLTLGGGFELALSCDYRIATPKTVIAFPETGIGIYPGLGGTQRTSRLVGVGMAKYLIATGQFVNAEKAYKYGLVDAIIEPFFDCLALANYHLEHSQAGKNSDHLEAAEFSDFDGSINDSLLTKEPYKTHQKTLSRKAPIALKMSMKLITEGAKLTLQQGLNLELVGLQTIFSTEDAKTGLLSILQRNKPEYIGR